MNSNLINEINSDVIKRLIAGEVIKFRHFDHKNVSEVYYKDGYIVLVNNTQDEPLKFKGNKILTSLLSQGILEWEGAMMLKEIDDTVIAALKNGDRLRYTLDYETWYLTYNKQDNTLDRKIVGFEGVGKKPFIEDEIKPYLTSLVKEGILTLLPQLPKK